MFKKRKVKSQDVRKRSEDDDPTIQELGGPSSSVVKQKVIKPNTKSSQQTKQTKLTSHQAESVIKALHQNDSQALEAKKQEKPVIKESITVDFQRDVCKDFLKNGYCGFGDTCKFLHYREEFTINDQKDGQVKEWDNVSKRKKY